MENNREHLYLAALLHDIGKFYQRADTGMVSTSRFLSELNKVESIFLPARKGVFTHKHCLWTAQFIEDHKAVFQHLTGPDFLNMTDKNNLFSLAACHHLKKEQLSDLGQLIKEADCLSSGMDRETELALKDDPDENAWDAFKKIRMTSVLETVHHGHFAVKYRLPVEKISLTKEYFPKRQFDTNPDYERLWADFMNEFKLVPANDYHAFCDTLLTFLYKYTSCIPASTVHFPDVSLYDHIKTTAAIAICLYDYMKSKPVASSKKDSPFLLIGANLSGIQSYLQIVSKYAGKTLKGRSFFLHILTDAIVRYLLKELNLFKANIVFNSGGSFYLLAPNTTFAKEKLQEAIQTIEKKLFDAFGTALFLAIDSVPVSKDDLMHKENATHLGVIWNNLFNQLKKTKSCQWAGLIEKDYAQFFEPSQQGGETVRDRITDEEFRPHEKSIPFEEAYFIKQNTYNQIELGKRLLETEYLVVSEKPCFDDQFNVNPADLGFHYYLLREEELTPSLENVAVIRFNNPDYPDYPVAGINNTYEFQFFGGNEFDYQAFDSMTDSADFSRMGILRMDVDNLGSIFHSGIMPGRATLSRFAALSRSLDYFFSGYLNTIWRESDPLGSFIIYSGGDDVLVAGSCDAVIRMAKQIHDDFGEFTCFNPAFSISGGVAIDPPKFPLMKGADESAKEEKAAKHHTVNGLSKNSLSLMDFPMNWQSEFPVIENLKNELVRLLEKEKAAKALLSKILAHATTARIQAHHITNIKTYWMLLHDLNRLKECVKESTKVLINNCMTEVLGTKPLLNSLPIETEYHPLELWAFAAKWAQLSIKI